MYLIIVSKLKYLRSGLKFKYQKYAISSLFFRYFYLIVFAMYIREVGPKDYNQTFKQWMDEHASLREMIAEGRSKIEWERKIPDEKLMDLKTQLDCAEFKTNLPKVCYPFIFQLIYLVGRSVRDDKDIPRTA